MIRPFKNEDMDPVLEIWLNGSLQAHEFIDSSYWHAAKTQMKNEYIPLSDTYVITEDAKHVLGFVSMVGDYLAALFIDCAQQNKGYGKRLLDFMKEKHERLELKVYQKNTSAVEFYLRNGFEITGESIDESTLEKEWKMSWMKN
ncbi:N-acetyltransferase [Ammoniphilus sp. YIM 78166]|uniref:N-acetyltransferase n=1 Tax=Ammoniphilus sp. YIM 78166 TaxID=1644106 RepID=UPI00106F420F|nr:N-acetyltransferase [Ammoniphilus sp. YIM 78166]